MADAEVKNLVDRFAPKAVLPYLRLARADRPIGFFLLALPCFWSVSLASRSLGEAYPDPWLLLLFAIGAIVMRGAGCTYNDIVDRGHRRARGADADAAAAERPGEPRVAAVIFMLLLCLVGLAVLLNLNRFSILARARRAADRRALSFRQAHQPLAAGRARARLQLGRTYGLGRGAWTPRLGRHSSSMPARSAWTIGYDTIYAHQDREDDGLLGSNRRRSASAAPPKHG